MDGVLDGWIDGLRNGWMLGLGQMNGRMSTQKKTWMVSWNIRNLKGKMIAQIDGWMDGGWIDG